LGILCAYFVGSIIFFLVSLKVVCFYRNLDIKKTLSAGLLLSAFGSFLCLFLQPQWRVFLLPYRFIYSRTWFSIQQIVANPLAIKMGSPDTAPLDTSRGIKLFELLLVLFTKSHYSNGK
jgi:FHS family L-fucose permease-like MFS transporter